MTTTHVKAQEIEERWLLFDASEQPLGRMATRIAQALMGKDRPTYTPSELCGAHVVVIHSAQARLTGKKEWEPRYARYSGYPGGLSVDSPETLRERAPNEIVRLAVRRMLPKTRLGRRMLSRLKIYPTADHPHAAQKPVKVEAPSA